MTLTPMVKYVVFSLLCVKIVGFSPLNIIYPKNCNACENKHVLEIHHQKLASLLSYERRTDYVFNWHLQAEIDMNLLKNNSEHLLKLVTEITRENRMLMGLRDKVEEIINILDEPSIVLEKLPLTLGDKIMSEYNLKAESESYSDDKILKRNAIITPLSVGTGTSASASDTLTSSSHNPITHLPRDNSSSSAATSTNPSVTSQHTGSVSTGSEEQTTINFLTEAPIEMSSTEFPILATITRDTNNNPQSNHSSPELLIPEFFKYLSKVFSVSQEITTMTPEGVTQQTTPSMVTDISNPLLENSVDLLEIANNISTIKSDISQLTTTLSNSLNVTEQLERNVSELFKKVTYFMDKQTSIEKELNAIRVEQNETKREWEVKQVELEKNVYRKMSLYMDSVLLHHEKQTHQLIDKKLLGTLKSLITAQRKHAVEMQELKDQLNELSANTSHEINNLREMLYSSQNSTGMDAKAYDEKLTLLKDTIDIHRDHDSMKIEMLEERDKSIMKKYHEHKLMIDEMKRLELKTQDSLSQIKDNIELIKQGVPSVGNDFIKLPEEEKEKLKYSDTKIKDEDHKELIDSISRKLGRQLDVKYQNKIGKLEQEIQILKNIISEKFPDTKRDWLPDGITTLFKSNSPILTPIIKDKAHPWTGEDTSTNSIGSHRFKQCKASGKFKLMPEGDKWCAEKCNLGYCPEDNCVCY